MKKTGCSGQQNKRKLLIPIVLLLGVLSIGAVIWFGGRKTAPEPAEDGEAVLSFSHESGVYAEDSLFVTITAPKGYTVAFTTDGTFPTAENDSGRSVVKVKLKKGMARYLAQHGDLQLMEDFDLEPILDDPQLPNGVMLCAALVDSTGNLGETEMKAFFLGMDLETLFPGALVVSVMTDPENLLDYHRGILATGAVYDEWRETEEAEAAIQAGKYWVAQTNSTQHGREWERPCIVQIYDGADTPAVEQAAGIRIQGGMSRSCSQKSLNVYFRNDYGENRMHFTFFPGIEAVKSFTLRNGGNGAQFNRMKYRDAMLQDLVSDRDVGIAQNRPAILFLNGEYWGVYMLSEKISDQMISDRYGVDRDQIVVIKDGEVEVGEDEDLQLYQELLAFADQDLSDPETYRRFCEIMDIRSLAEFCAIRVYLGDADWGNTESELEKNMVLWRTKDQSFNYGRWQFILYDLEQSAGLYGVESTAYDTNHLRLAMERVPLFAAAMHNSEFCEMFLNALREIGTGSYSRDRVEEAIQDYDKVWRPLLENQFRRFGYPDEYYNETIADTLNFFDQRNDYILSFIGEL